MASLARSDFHSVRREMRFPTNFKAILNWANKFAFVQVADIANCGMRLIGEDLPPRGERVRIGTRGLNESGRVIWRTEHGCGIVLRRRIDALFVVRSNCFPLSRRIRKEVPLGAIQPKLLTEHLLDTFPSEDSALAFLRGSEAKQGSRPASPA